MPAELQEVCTDRADGQKKMKRLKKISLTEKYFGEKPIKISKCREKE